MLKKIKNKDISGLIPPWIFIGLAVILLPVFSFITMNNIREYRVNFNYLMLGKGAAIIKTFEAGTMAGIGGMNWGIKERQTLISEIVKESDIAYLAVTNINGGIIAHSDPAFIGKEHINKQEIFSDKINIRGDLKWHKVTTPENKKIFEVFRVLSSACFYRNRHCSEKDKFCIPPRPHPDFNKKEKFLRKQIIFAGFDISAFEKSRRHKIYYAIGRGVIFFLISLSGILSLFITLGYRNANAMLKKEIAEARRLASIGKLAAGVAHEIRNPLSSIKGFATYFKEKKINSEKERNIAAIMSNEVERVNRAVSDLLEFSVPAKLYKNRINIKAIILNSLKLIENKAAKKFITVKTEFDRNFKTVNADKDLIKPALFYPNLHLRF
jgi:two-component system sensor histidine kinase HydH